MLFEPHDLRPRELASLRAAERRGAIFIAYLDGAGELRIHPLEEGRRLTIGRGAENDLALSWDTSISRTHAILEPVGGEWTILDDGLSRNGSFVNEERVAGHRRLSDGDVLRLGKTPILFRAPAAPGVDVSSGRFGTTAAADSGALAQLTPAQRRVLVALCRPLVMSRVGATPASNQQIAEELSLSLEGVRTQIRALFRELEIPELPPNRKRAELARRALASGLVSERQLRETLPGH